MQHFIAGMLGLLTALIFVCFYVGVSLVGAVLEKYDVVRTEDVCREWHDAGAVIHQIQTTRGESHER